jgi:hypothetical protein
LRSTFPFSGPLPYSSGGFVDWSVDREGRQLVQRRSRPPIVGSMPVAVSWWLDLGAHIWPLLRFLLLFLELLSSEQKTMEKAVAPMNKSVMV